MYHTRPSHRFLGLCGFLFVCFVIASAGGAITASNIASWYQIIQKPSFTPPNWLFGPAWTFLYVLIAISGWKIWCLKGFGRAQGAFRIYAAQLFLNLIWSFLFFGAHSPILGLIDICILLILIIFNIRLFWQINHFAAIILVPYALWVGFATILNAAIFALN